MGLLIDLHYLVQQIWVIGAALVVVTGGKTVLNFILLTLAGKKFDTAFEPSLFLSPVGEFSFVIAGAGLAAGALSPDGHKLAIAVIAMSLLVSPIFFLFARLMHRKITTGQFRARRAEPELDFILPGHDARQAPGSILPNTASRLMKR